MEIRFSVAILMLGVIATCPINAVANTCEAKRIKVKQVCGVVLDGSDRPIQEATVQIVSTDGQPLSTPVLTQADGGFSFFEAPEQESMSADFYFPVFATDAEAARRKHRPNWHSCS